MKKRFFWLAALINLSVFGMAQQVLPQDMAGDKEYARVCKEYELKAKNSIAMLKAYLKQYPDSRHANRVESMIASVYFEEGNYQEAIAKYRSCDLDALSDKERDDAVLKLAVAYLKEGNLKEATVWFTLLKDIGKTHRADAVFNLGYIDYVEGRYDQALKAFVSLKEDETYDAIVPYYIGEIHLLREEYEDADKLASDYLHQFPGHKNEAEMNRIQGEARYGLNDYLTAVASLEAYLTSVDQPQRTAMYKLGMSYYHTGVYSKAAELLGRTTLKQDALAQNAFLHMGLAFLKLKDRHQARMAFEQASIGDLDKSVKEQALYNYALCIHETAYSPFAESVTVFERFLNEFPHSGYSEKVSDYLVETYMNTRSYDAALKSIAKISNPGSRILEAKQKILFRLGTQAFANANFMDALQYFNRSLELGQYNPEVMADSHYWRGEVNYRLGNYRDAGGDLRRFLELTTNKHNQEYGLALYNLGYTDFKQKNYSNALMWFSRFVNESTNSNRQVMADAYNRMGDCYFYVRNFDEARLNYDKAEHIDPSLGDYSLFQEGFVKGLQRDYTGKIQALNQLITNYPQSPYIDDALYEQGRAFVQLEDNSNAIERFQLLVKNFPQSKMAPRAANEVGLLYYQDDKYPEAITVYKNVIKNYPGSEEARLAQRDLKSIYIDLNKVDEYADFVSTIPNGVNFDVNERDSLTYVAAERVYMRGETANARNSFVRYLQTFPEGAFSLSANYYIGLIDYNQQNYASAKTHLQKVLEFPNNKYSEEAMMMSAEMHYVAKDYTQALEFYKLLKDRASTAERRQLATTGMLRSAAMSGNDEETILAATAVLSDVKVSPEQENEARHYRSKALVNAGQMQHAAEDWKALAKDTRNIYGAEAKYRLAQYLFDSGKTAEAEKEVLDYLEVSTPHAYWLARGFVLLSDIYTKLDRKLEARQYLLSLKQNYQADDDIAGMIESRLENLSE